MLGGIISMQNRLVSRISPILRASEAKFSASLTKIRSGQASPWSSTPLRKYTTDANKARTVASTTGAGRRPKSNELLAWEARQNAPLTPVQMAVEAGKDVSYFFIILAGMGLSGIFSYVIGSTLLGGSDVKKVIVNAMSEIKKDQGLKAILGDDVRVLEMPQVGGRSSGTGRQSKSDKTVWASYEVDGEVFTRLRFEIEGSYTRATVQLEIKNGAYMDFLGPFNWVWAKPRFDYRYLVVDVRTLQGSSSVNESFVLINNMPKAPAQTFVAPTNF